MRSPARLPGAALGLALLLLPAAAAAEPGDAEISARLRRAEQILAKEQEATRLWYDSWLAFFGAGAMAQAAFAANAPGPPSRIGGIVGATKSALAFGFMLARPVTGRIAADLLAPLPDDTPAARLRKLRHAEALLRAVADEERGRRHWFPVLGGALVNVAGAWTVWATAKSRGAAWVSLASGIAVAQLHLFTQPTAVMRLRLVPDGLGMAVQGSF